MDIGVKRPLPALVVGKRVLETMITAIFPIIRAPILAKLLCPTIVSIDGSLIRLILEHRGTLVLCSAQYYAETQYKIKL
ncbi:MAG: hypothetical protein GY737_10200 [Desulfobacteraceae bacterium]|nr:hypothetical protein [Desulfobacteraceae bacterium]